MEDANEQVRDLWREERTKPLHFRGFEEDLDLFDCVCFFFFLIPSEPQRHLLRVQRLRSTKHPTDPGLGQARVA